MTPPVVLVEWRDAMSATPGWVSVDEAKRYAREAWSTPMLAAGLLVEDGADYVVLAVGWNPNPDQPEVSGAIMIPRSEITRIAHLAEQA